MRPWLRFLISCISFSFLLIACNPTFSPPARVNGYGAPAKFEQHQIEANASYFSQGVLGFSLNYAPQDYAQVEVGGDVGVTDHEFWTTYLGMRFAPFPANRQKERVKLLWDLETGVGMGLGGESCGNNPDMNDPTGECVWDGISSYDRMAGGGYLGTGIGFNVDFFDAYLRGRIQATDASGLPATFWGTGLAGIQFTILDLVKLYGGVGYGGFVNSEDQDHGMILEGGIGFLWDLPGVDN